jgi:hypothetical protein
MYAVAVNGDLDDFASGETTVFAGLDHLSVQLSINEEGGQPTSRCANCGEESGDDTPDDGPCPGSGVWGTCTHCNGSKKCSVCEDIEYERCDCTLCDGSGKCDECDDDGQAEIHAWEPIPLHWCNSASIHARPDRDSIQVSISVGDARGAFVMEVERREDGLYLSVPHPEANSQHMELTERSPGWYKVG